MKKFLYYLILVLVFLLIWLLFCFILAMFFKRTPSGILMFLMVGAIWSVFKYLRPIIKDIMHIDEHCADSDDDKNEHIDENSKIEIGDIVMEIKTQKEFRVKQLVGENEFECMERYGAVYSILKKDEIKLLCKK